MHPPGQPRAIWCVAKPPVPRPGRAGASWLPPPWEPAPFEGQICWQSPEAGVLNALLAVGCTDADPCRTPEGNPSAHPGCWQGYRDAAWVVQPLGVLPCPKGQSCAPKNRAWEGLWEMWQHPWECQQPSPFTAGGGPLPAPLADCNRAQIIILNYNLQQIQNPICLIPPAPSINPPALGLCPGWGEWGHPGASPATGEGGGGKQGASPPPSNVPPGWE